MRVILGSFVSDLGRRLDEHPADDVRVDPGPGVVLAALADDEHVESP